MIPFNIAALLGHVVKVPDVDYQGCDALLWKEGDEIYLLDVPSGDIGRMKEGMLARFITDFPRDLTLCIMNDQTGQPVRISPLAN